MMKKTDYRKIEILGMHVDNYTVRESLLRLDTYMSNSVLNIIETVTMKQLISAGENPVIRDCLEQADLCIIGECEILLETGNGAAQRMREVREQDFLCELLKRIVRTKRRVFLIAMTEEEIEHMQEVFEKQAPRFSPAGSFPAESCTGDLDTMVNEINGATPDIVISALNSPFEEEFILSHKDKIGTSIWYGIGNACEQIQGKRQMGRTLKKLALRGKLRHSVSKYQQNMNEGKK